MTCRDVCVEMFGTTGNCCKGGAAGRAPPDPAGEKGCEGLILTGIICCGVEYDDGETRYGV